MRASRFSCHPRSRSHSSINIRIHEATTSRDLRDLRAGLGRLALFAVTGVVPAVLAFGALWAVGVWERFWFWTVEYGLAYASRVPVSAAPGLLGARMVELVREAPLLWALAGIGITAPLWSTRVRRERAFFRGSVYWYRRHGRTRAFAQSMASPHELDADWLA